MRPRNPWVQLVLAGLLLVSCIPVSWFDAAAAEQPAEMGPFEIEYAYDVSLPNPVTDPGMATLNWQVELVPIDPNTVRQQGRVLLDDPDIYGLWEHNAAAQGAQVLLVVEGTVLVESAQASGSLAEGEGTSIAEVPDKADLDDYQYFLSNPTSSCAIVLRISIFSRGNMGGGGRASKDIPKLASSCGGTEVLYTGGAPVQTSDEQVKIAVSEYWSTGFHEDPAVPKLQILQDALLIVQSGNVWAETQDCSDCDRQSSKLYPPSTLILAAGQFLELRPSYTVDTRLFFIAVHEMSGSPQIYQPAY